MTEKELNSVRELDGRIKALESHLATMRKRAQDITPKLDGLPHSSDIRSKVEKLALAIVEQGKELDTLHKKIISAAAELTEKICREVAEPQARTILILRYIACLNFRDIGFQLGKSDATIFRIHHDALKMIVQ